MALLCNFGLHKPSVQSLRHHKDGGHAGLCQSCGVPLYRSDKGSWRTATGQQTTR